MRVKIQFEIEVPDDATDEDLVEWVRFEVGDNGMIRGANQLIHRELTPIFGTLTID